MVVETILTWSKVTAESREDEEGFTLSSFGLGLSHFSVAGWCCWLYVLFGVWSGSNRYDQQGKDLRCCTWCCFVLSGSLGLVSPLCMHWVDIWTPLCMFPNTWIFFTRTFLPFIPIQKAEHTMNFPFVSPWVCQFLAWSYVGEQVCWLRQSKISCQWFWFQMAFWVVLDCSLPHHVLWTHYVMFSNYKVYNWSQYIYSPTTKFRRHTHNQFWHGSVKQNTHPNS